MTVQEEERIKGSLLSASAVTDHLNRCIYDCVVIKPSSIVTFEDFLEKCSLKDRDALLYGLYHITYEEIRNYDVGCAQCGKKYSITINASDTFSMNSYPADRNILDERFQINLPIMSSVSISIKQPTLKEEALAMKLAGSNSKLFDVLTETLIIETVIESVEGADSVVYSSREDIIDAYRALPPNDKSAIFNEYKDKLGNYGIELKMKSTCIHCGEEEEIDLDLVDNFFRMVHSL
jgi:hypothetical protein